MKCHPVLLLLIASAQLAQQEIQHRIVHLFLALITYQACLCLHLFLLHQIKVGVMMV